jgi:phosphoglycerate dehydrogenase-like enzyme
VHVDVFPEEPWPGLQQAATHPAVWLSPHASGFVHDLGERVAHEVIETLRAWCEGQPPPHPVPPQES